MFQRFIYTVLILVVLWVVINAIPSFPYGSTVLLIAAVLGALYVIGGRISA